MSITNLDSSIQTTIICQVFTDTALGRQDTAQPLLLLGKTDNKNANTCLTKLLTDVDDKSNEKALCEGDWGSSMNV